MFGQKQMKKKERKKKGSCCKILSPLEHNWHITDKIFYQVKKAHQQEGFSEILFGVTYC